jgi:hypothetical protein
MDSDWISGISVVLSVLAFLASMFALLRSVRVDKRDLFLKMHERLVEPEIQVGRRLLHQQVKSIDDVGRIEANQPGAFDQMNRALAMFDLLGLYVEKRYIAKKLVLDEWADPLRRIWTPAELFIRHRQRPDMDRLWPHFEKLVGQAQEHPRKPRPAQSPG